jgi:Domain of unknown function (DUF4365)
LTHMSWQQQEFSFAYIQAVASVAGYSVERNYVDYDGIDLGICAHGAGGAVRSPRVDVQVKSITAGRPSRFPWSYALDVDNYDSLHHADLAVPRILVVVAMPKNVANWVKATPQQLTVRHAGYWISLRGAPPTSNASTVTVHFPANHRLTPHELQAIMTRISQGSLP